MSNTALAADGPTDPGTDGSATLADLIQELRTCTEQAQRSADVNMYTLLGLVGALVLLVLVFGSVYYSRGGRQQGKSTSTRS